MTKQSVIIFFSIVAALIIGFIGGHFFFRKPPVSLSLIPLVPKEIRADSEDYHFINPLLYLGGGKDLYVAEYKNLVSSLTSFASSSVQKGVADNVSVYFRDLNNGHWTGVNEDALYEPSSMLKVVAMMATLRLAQDDPSILSKKLYFSRTDPSKAAYIPDDTYTSGYYSVEDLIVVMIKNSDNDAYNALVSDPDISNEFTQLYSLLRLPPQNPAGAGIDFMSPRSFSAIWRALYDSSLFEWGLSEQILSLLSQTTFTQGLVAGVPSGTVVAHKFGENTDELHDCGIVYYPTDPYLICVMTKGQNVSQLESVISGVSKIIYDYVAASTTPSVTTPSK